MDVVNERSDRRIVQLDGWRGISILFVVVGHTINRRYNPHPDFELSGVSGVLSTWGVNIFFVISGFIITKLALQEYEQSGHFSTRNFYTRRFFRIIPPFFLYLTAVILAIALSLIDQRYSETLPAAVFICNIPSVNCGWFVGHSWTLAYEEQFYVTFPLLFLLTGSRIRELIAALFFVLVAFPFLRFILHMNEGWRVVANLAPSFSYICAGAVMAAYEKYVKRLSTGHHAVYISYVAALFLAGLLLLDATDVPFGSLLAYLRVSLNNTILVGCVAWLVVSSTYRSNIFTRVLTASPLLFLGKISYSLYLWQQLFTASPSRYISESALFIFPLMFVIAIFSYFFVERPFVRFGKRIVTT